MPSTGLEACAITEMADFLSEGFTQKFNEFLNGVGGFYPWCFSQDSIKMSAPLFMRNGGKPFFVMVTCGGKLVAFLPMQTEEFGRYPLQYRRLKTWGHAGLYNDNYRTDFLCLPEYLDRAPETAMQFLSSTFKNNFDEIVFGRVVKEPPFYNLLDKYFGVSDFLNNKEKRHIYKGEVRLDSHVTGDKRRKIKRGTRQLRDVFSTIEYCCHDSIDDELFDNICKMHIARQKEFISQGKSRMNFLENPTEREVFRNKLMYAQEKGALRIYTLRLDSEMASFLLCFSFGGFTEACLTSFAKMPGHNYMTRCLWHYAFDQELNHHGTRVIDMGHGTNLLKKNFSTDLVPLTTISFENDSRIISRLKNRTRDLQWQLKKLGRRYSTDPA